jgi:hypothetical protein
VKATVAGALVATMLSALVTAGLATPAQAAGTITAHVAHTEGAPLMVRSGPGTGYGAVGQLGSSEYVEISCQKAGETIHGNAYWDWIPAYGGYSSDHYLYTSEGNGRLSSLPLCGTNPPSTTLRTRIKQIAEAELGLTDGTKYHPGIGSPSDAWCQYFVNWVWARAGVANMFNANGFTGNFYWWAVNRGLARNWPTSVNVGDAVLFGTGPANPDTSLHVGIVVEKRSDGQIVTVDGNYANRVARVGPYYPESAWTWEPAAVYAVVSPQ